MAQSKGSWRRSLEGKIFIFYKMDSSAKMKDIEEKLNKIILLTKAGQYRVLSNHENHTLLNVLVNVDGQGIACVVRKHDRAIKDILNPKPFGTKLLDLEGISSEPDPDAVEESFYLHTKYRARFRNQMLLEKEDYDAMNRAIRENNTNTTLYLCDINSAAFAENQYKSRLYLISVQDRYLLVPFREPHGIRTVFLNGIIHDYRKEIPHEIRKNLILHPNGQVTLKEGVVLASLQRSKQ